MRFLRQSSVPIAFVDCKHTTGPAPRLPRIPTHPGREQWGWGWGQLRAGGWTLALMAADLAMYYGQQERSQCRTLSPHLPHLPHSEVWPTGRSTFVRSEVGGGGWGANFQPLPMEEPRPQCVMVHVRRWRRASTSRSYRMMDGRTDGAGEGTWREAGKLQQQTVHRQHFYTAPD